MVGTLLLIFVLSFVAWLFFLAYAVGVVFYQIETLGGTVAALGWIWILRRSRGRSSWT